MKKFDRNRFNLKKFTEVVIKQEKQDWIGKVKRALVKIKAIKCLAEHFCDPKLKVNRKYITDIPNFNLISKCRKEKNKKKIIEEEIKQSEGDLLENENNKEALQNFERRNNIFDNKEEKLIKNSKIHGKKNKFLFEKTNLAIEFFKKKFLKIDFNQTPFNFFDKKSKRENNSVEMTSMSKDTFLPVFISTGFQFLKIEHKYSFSFNGSYFVKIDMGGKILLKKRI